MSELCDFAKLFHSSICGSIISYDSVSYKNSIWKLEVNLRGKELSG